MYSLVTLWLIYDYLSKKERILVQIVIIYCINSVFYQQSSGIWYSRYRKKIMNVSIEQSSDNNTRSAGSTCSLYVVTRGYLYSRLVPKLSCTWREINITNIESLFKIRIIFSKLIFLTVFPEIFLLCYRI